MTWSVETARRRDYADHQQKARGFGHPALHDLAVSRLFVQRRKKRNSLITIALILSWIDERQAPGCGA
jgi:hypothetical protein